MMEDNWYDGGPLMLASYTTVPSQALSCSYGEKCELQREIWCHCHITSIGNTMECSWFVLLPVCELVTSNRQVIKYPERTGLSNHPVKSPVSCVKYITRWDGKPWYKGTLTQRAHLCLRPPPCENCSHHNLLININSACHKSCLKQQGACVQVAGKTRSTTEPQLLSGQQSCVSGCDGVSDKCPVL